MNIREKNIEIFLENRELSYTDYREDTENLLNNTLFYESAKDSVEIKDRKQKIPEINFITDDTSHCGYQWKKDHPTERVAILNFADALEPGGLVEYGEFTQEEAICRSSNLYESLLLGKEFYYEYNSSLRSQLYSNRLIYSRDVLIFREDYTGVIYKDPQYVDVITCPAPSIRMSTVEFNELITSRVECIIKSAYANGVNTIVLGAWGCGAFGQNPVVIGGAFGKILKRYKVFDNIIFAFKSLNGDKNMKLFKDGFTCVYGELYIE